jgi:PAS domain S-box-containing protein
MNLQQKTMVVFFIVYIALVVTVGIFGSTILLSSYSSLENEYTVKDLNQAVNHVNGEAIDLAEIAADWGPWDDTYNFVAGNQSGYIRSNLLPETYDNLNLNLFIIADTKGNIVYSRGFDLRNKTIANVPDFFTRPLAPDNPLMNVSDPRGSTSGLIILKEYPLLIASRPIVKSDYSGTPRGVVILGRTLTEEEIHSLAESTQPSLQLRLPHDPSVDPGLLSVLTSAPGPVPEVVEPVSRDTISGSALIRDIYGNDGLVLTISEPRHIYLQGINTILQFIGIILVTGMLTGIGMLVFLDKNILSRVGALSLQVKTIGRDTELSRRVVEKGNDELSGLEQEINRMLTKIEKSHTEIQKSEERFRELSDLLPQVIFEMDPQGNIVYVNKFGIEIFGLADSDTGKKLPAELFLVPEDIDKMHRNLERVARGIASSGDVYTLIKKDKTRIRAIVYSSPIIHDGKLEGFRGSVIDITERLQLEEALAENEEYLKTLLATVQVGIVVIETDTFRIIDANPAALDMIGATKDVVLSNVCHTFICPAVDGHCPVVDLGQKVDNSERILVTCDGRKIPIIKYVVPVLLHGKHCLLETFIDNSYRKKIEQQLSESEERYRTLTENTPDILFSTDLTGRVTYVSPQINQYGYLPDEIIGHPMFDLLHPEDRRKVQDQFMRELSEGAQFSSTFRLADKWGNIHWFEEKSFLHLDEYGRGKEVLGMLRDITERRRAEDAIELANKKLNLMNNITRHDILNTLTGLLGCVDMARATTLEEERRLLLSEIKELARVIERQINFTRQYQEVGVHLPLWQNVGEVISGILVNFGNSGIRFEIALEKTEIYADPLLEKVFYNLVDNAIRYGKTITGISFYFLISDKGLSLICEDDGIGIPSESKQNIFDRGVGQNTGMGLFLSREILSITRIEIQENGVPGRGARFEMLIPRGAFRFTQ